MGTHSSYDMGYVSKTVVTLLEVSKKEEGVVAIGPLKTFSGLEPVPRCEPNTYQPIRI